MEKMEVDDVVDLSIGRESAVSLSNATVRDLRALTQNAGLTITPAPPSVNNGMCTMSKIFTANTNVAVILIPNNKLTFVFFSVFFFHTHKKNK